MMPVTYSRKASQKPTSRAPQDALPVPELEGQRGAGGLRVSRTWRLLGNPEPGARLQELWAAGS